jgi:2-oxoglutarate dehydrogenase E2 component (dihydrolipoamide succinyltransferase)
MPVEIRVPTLGESVTEATVARWLKQPGEAIARDEPIVELETDKVTLEVPAPAAGTLGEIRAAEGDNVPVGGILGVISESAAAASPSPARGAAAAPSPAGNAAETASAAATDTAALLERSGPAMRKLVAESGTNPAAIIPTGRGGRITRADVAAAERREPTPLAIPEPTRQAQTPVSPPPAEMRPAGAPPAAPPATIRTAGERETRVRMTRLRRRIAERLKAAQDTAAMLTTFNEIDMSAAMALRERWRDAFEKKHGVRLGFMSIFVKAAIVALKEFPAVNAEIDGDDIIYKNHYDIGVAVGTEQGLVVPVVRDADGLSFAAIEQAIGAFGRKARDGKLTIEDLSGGTFTISNGGVYGSLLSTPILNPPQSAILGMHKIERRPVAIGDKIEIRPMMYAALSYDHRIIDGREAVSFLVRLKEGVEDPDRLLFDL